MAAERERVWGPSRGPANAGAPARNDHPLVLPFASASKEDALAAANSEESKGLALSALKRDVVANSTRLFRDSRLRLFEELHHKWFGSTLPWIPLSPLSLIHI